MYVYLVFCKSFEEAWVAGVFSTATKAEACVLEEEQDEYVSARIGCWEVK